MMNVKLFTRENLVHAALTGIALLNTVLIIVLSHVPSGTVNIFFHGFIYSFVLYYYIILLVTLLMPFVTHKYMTSLAVSFVFMLTVALAGGGSSSGLGVGVAFSGIEVYSFPGTLLVMPLVENEFTQPGAMTLEEASRTYKVEVNDVAYQSGGGMVAAAHFFRQGGAGWSFTDYHFRLARFNPDGSFDDSFACDRSLFRADTFPGVNFISARQDDSMVLVSWFNKKDDPEHAQYARRLDISLMKSNGDLIKTVPVSRKEYQFREIINVLWDGRNGLYFIGLFGLIERGRHEDDYRQSTIIKISLDGTIDRKFKPFPARYGTEISSNIKSVDSDGNLLFWVLQHGPTCSIMRLGPDGSLDTRFRRNLAANPRLHGLKGIRHLAFDSKDRILVSGESDAGGYFIARLNRDGSHDASFNAEKWIPGGHIPELLIEQRNGSVLVLARKGRYGNEREAHLYRVSPEGARPDWREVAACTIRNQFGDDRSRIRFSKGGDRMQLFYRSFGYFSCE